ncbi:MAG: hypothetical protein ACRD4F_00190, partial [Candidatus Angelobacter sp.]
SFLRACANWPAAAQPACSDPVSGWVTGVTGFLNLPPDLTADYLLKPAIETLITRITELLQTVLFLPVRVERGSKIIGRKERNR